MPNLKLPHYEFPCTSFETHLTGQPVLSRDTP